LVVMTADRPAILRNVSLEGSLAFVDWTPADALPAGDVFQGFSAATLDADGDGDVDLFLGGSTGDHVFERVRLRPVREALLGDGLPPLVGAEPLVVSGRVAPGEVDDFVLGDLGGRGHLAVVLSDMPLASIELPGGTLRRDRADLVLEILADGVVQGTSDRGGRGVEEVLQVELGSGVHSVRVSNTAATGTGEYRLELLARHDGPANDFCAEALLIGEGLTPFTNLGAQTDGPAHAVCFAFGDDQVPSDVWYDYLATCTGVLTVSTCGLADYDTKLAVYAGNACPVDDERLLGCEEDTTGCPGYTSIVTVPVIAGEWYKIRVGGWLGAQGSGMLSVSCR